MALTPDEQQLYNAFCGFDLLDPKYAYPFIEFCRNVYTRDYNERHYLIPLCNNIKNGYMQYLYNVAMKNPDNEEILDRLNELTVIYWEILKLEAQNRNVDSYFLYIEKNRDPKDKFYQPRRRLLRKHGVIQGLQALIDDELDVLTISLPPGTGKGQPDSAKILTPTGFKTFADIELGMEIVAGNGKIAHIVGIFPQGKRKCYRFTFDDGSSCIVSDNHLWETQTRDDRRRSHKTRIVETSKMLTNYRVEKGKRCNYSIEYVPNIEFTAEPLKIHPYVMGSLLGNGGLSGSSVKITTPDKCVIERINKLLPGDYRFELIENYDYTLKGYYGFGRNNHNYVRESMIYYDLLGKHSYEKHIPKEYLYASYEDRLELLRGLMDSDGSASKTCNEYTTTSERLANDVCELVHSLGGYCSINKRENCGYNDKDGNFIKCRDAYRLIVQFSASQPNPFWLKRKAEIYAPKRDKLLRFITDIEYIGEHECKCILIDDPSHLYVTDDYIITHNTSCEKFFHSAVAGWFPRDFSLFYSHSDSIAKMYYDSVCDIITNNVEYTWREIFPFVKLGESNAKRETFNVGTRKDFASIQCTSVGSRNAGQYRCSKFLFVDDMIGSIDEALNKQTLDKLWNDYAVDARQRKITDSQKKMCKELHIATRWSVHDVIGRLQRMYENDPTVRTKFIAVPDIDPETGDSNFAYDMYGYTVDDFKSIEKLMDDISYRCLYKQDPIEREGLLYHSEELRRYSVLPSSEPDAVLGVCDTKTTGIDYMFLPVFYVYGNDYYLEDCICDDSADFNVQYERCTNIILAHNMQQVEFESNAGGSRIAHEVQERVKKLGGGTNIITKATETNKETRIIVNSDWIKKNVLFKDNDCFQRKSDYGRMMDFLLSYTVSGKNKHDDVPDGLANFALYISRKFMRREAVIIDNPFW